MLNFDDDEYSQGYDQIKEAFIAPTKDDILQSYIFNKYLRSSNEVNDISYSFYVLDIRYQENFTSAQPIEVEFKFDGVVP